MNMLKILGLGTLTLALSAATACSDDNGSSSSNNNGGNGGSSSSSGGSSSSSSGTGGMGPECGGPGQTFENIDSAVGDIDGTILDIQGNPAQDLLSDICGTNICLSGSTDATGKFSTVGGNSSVIDVRLIYGSGLRYAQMTSPIADPTGFSFGTINTVALPAYGDGAAIAAGSSSTSNGVTIDVDAASDITLDIILYPTATEQVFRATVFTPAEGNFPAVPASSNIEGLVATAPINTTFCPGVRLTVPNTFGFAADADIEVLYHGTSILTEYAPYGGWAPVAEAAVSSDGTTISLKSGESIEELGVFGFRLKQ